MKPEVKVECVMNWLWGCLNNNKPKPHPRTNATTLCSCLFPVCLQADSQPPDTVKVLAAIRNSGARLLTLINDILDASALRKVGGWRREIAGEQSGRW